MIKVAELLKRGVGGSVRLVVVTGEEPFLREQAVRKVLESLDDDVEVRTLPGDGVELRDLLDDLRMQGLFGGDQLIHLKDADGFVKEHEKTLVRFLEEGEAVQRLLIEGKALMGKGRKTLPKRGFLAAVGKLDGLVVQCDPLFDSPFKGQGPAWQSPLSRWVVERAAELGKRLSMEDAYVLHRMVGNKLRELDGELKKLTTFVKERPRITGEDIERCVGEGRLAPVFDLAEAVAGRKGAEAIEQSQLLFERGLTDFSGRHVRDAQSVAMMILGATGSRLRKVARVREMMAQGESFDEAAAAVRQPPLFRDRLRAQVEAWREAGALDKAFGGLLEFERELKSGGGAPRVLMDRFLVKSLVPPRSGRRQRKAKGGRPWSR